MPKLGEYKIHTCCICHSVVANKPHRLVYQRWNDKKCQYQNRTNFDFCDKCFIIFKNWIRKHREGDKEL